jgi:electron transport complex protein RnfE
MTTSLISALGMGLAAMVVLICSNVAISALRKVIPDSVRIPCYIVVIAAFVTLVQMVMHAYLPELYEMLGVYLALIVVNCIILGRAEMFARNHGIVDSALDGLGMGLGFTAALLAMALIRECLGVGTFAGIEIPVLSDFAVPGLAMAPGGFLVFGIMIAVVNKLTDGDKKNDTVDTIASLISIGIAVVLEYVNYCSLAWVFHKKEQNAFKSTCDGAVIYFQNWKTLLANVGKILGITVLSLIVICLPLIVGGAFVFIGVEPIALFCEAIDAAFELELGTVGMMSAVVIGIMLWSGLHGAFVKPYIMVSVMRGYIAAGEANPPKVDIYGKLSDMSKSFKKALGKAQESGEVMA